MIRGEELRRGVGERCPSDLIEPVTNRLGDDDPVETRRLDSGIRHDQIRRSERSGGHHTGDLPRRNDGHVLQWHAIDGDRRPRLGRVSGHKPIALDCDLGSALGVDEARENRTDRQCIEILDTAQPGVRKPAGIGHRHRREAGTGARNDHANHGVEARRRVVAAHLEDAGLQPADLDDRALLELMSDDRELGPPAGRRKSGIDLGDLRLHCRRLGRGAETPPQIGQRRHAEDVFDRTVDLDAISAPGRQRRIEIEKDRVALDDEIEVGERHGWLRRLVHDSHRRRPHAGRRQLAGENGFDLLEAGLDE